LETPEDKIFDFSYAVDSPIETPGEPGTSTLLLKEKPVAPFVLRHFTGCGEPMDKNGRSCMPGPVQTPALAVSELLSLLRPPAADMGVVAELRVEGLELGPADRAGLPVNPVIGLLLPFREHNVP
jgi:hypothetical protein